MASGQMKKIVRNVYWANKSFDRPGLWIWTGKHNMQIFPRIYVEKD